METDRFYLAHLVTVDGDRVASEEVWMNGPPVSLAHVAETAAGFFAAAYEEPENESHRINVFGPFMVDDTAPLAAFALSEDDDGEWTATPSEEA